MSNYLRKLGVFVTPPPLTVPTDTTLSGYVINTNGLRPTTIHGAGPHDAGRLNKKMSILRDLASELKLDVLHVTESHDHQEDLTTPSDKWSCHRSVPGIKSQGAASFTRLNVTKGSSATNVTMVEIQWEKEAITCVTAYFPNDLTGTIATTKEVSFSARFSTVGFSSNFSQPQKAQNGADISIFLKIQTVQI